MYLYFVSGMSILVRFFALRRIQPHNPLLVRAPVHSLSFNLAVVLPRWNTYVCNCGTEGVSPPTPSIHRLQRGLPGYLILFAPPRFRASASVVVQQAAFATGVPPNIYAFHRYTRNSACLSDTQEEQFKCSLWVKPIDFTSDLLSRLHALYTQSIRQRLPPTYYRGCWHVVSRGFFSRYRHVFVPGKRSLQPESLLPSRGVAGSGCPHCPIFPTAASRRSLGRISVPMWPFNLSVRLLIVALVGRYPTN